MILLCLSIFDLGYTGNMETLSNNQQGEKFISARLDRFMANKDWTNIYLYYSNTHLPRLNSDHNHILLEFHSDLFHRVKRNPKDKPKRFEKLWMEKFEIEEIISKSLNYYPNRGPNSKTRMTMENLCEWGKKDFGNPAIEINKVKGVIRTLQEDNYLNKKFRTIRYN